MHSLKSILLFQQEPEEIQIGDPQFVLVLTGDKIKLVCRRDSMFQYEVYLKNYLHSK